VLHGRGQGKRAAVRLVAVCLHDHAEDTMVPDVRPYGSQCNGTIRVPPSGTDGAYQQSCDHVIAPQYTTPCPVNDWNTTSPTASDYNNYNFAETIVTGMTARGSCLQGQAPYGE
jgi:hypothetical protein